MVADLFQGVVHLRASRGHHHSVLHSVKDIDGKVFHGLGVSGIAAAADGNGRRESLRSSLQGVPNAKGPHGETTNVNVFGIHGAAVDETVHQSEHALHLRCRFGLHLVFGQTPVCVDPSLPLRALWRHKEERIIASDGVVEEILDAMFQLCSIVVAAFSGTMKKYDQRQRLSHRFGFFRSIESIREGVLAFNVNVGLEQCCVGLLSQRGLG